MEQIRGAQLRKSAAVQGVRDHVPAYLTLRALRSLGPNNDCTAVPRSLSHRRLPPPHCVQRLGGKQGGGRGQGGERTPCL